VDAVVTVRDLRMRYGDNDVLTGVAFHVERGQVVCLLGPNGAGKTTTIEILEGFRIRSAGEVTVLGQDPAVADEDWRARTGVVLQSWRDHPRWTPRRLLTQLGGYFAPYSTPDRQRPHDVGLLLETVGLTDLADRKIAALSGGQRWRLGHDRSLNRGMNRVLRNRVGPRIAQHLPARKRDFSALRVDLNHLCVQLVPLL
jgi:ABC-2 type transport system ATP-binding protein